MRSLALFGLVSGLLAACAVDAAARAPAKPASSGETQVVAKAGPREITLSELRVEMSRLGLGVNAPDSERIALDSIISRSLLVEAARSANLHRRPESVLRMQAAQDQALADFEALAEACGHRRELGAGAVGLGKFEIPTGANWWVDDFVARRLPPRNRARSTKLTRRSARASPRRSVPRGRRRRPRSCWPRCPERRRR